MIIEIDKIIKKNSEKIFYTDKTREFSFIKTYNLAKKVSEDIEEYIENNKINRKELKCGLIFEQGIEGIVAMIACLLSNIVYIPIDRDNPKERIKFMLENSNSRLIIHSSEENCNIEIDYDYIAGKINIFNYFNKNFILENNLNILKIKNYDETNIMYHLYTSGSTGRPKAIVQTNKNVKYYIETYRENLNINPWDNLTLFSSYGHDAAIVDIFSALTTGCSLNYLNLKNINNFMLLDQWLEEKSITIWHSVPTILRNHLKFSRIKNKEKKLKKVVLGGEKIKLYEFIELKKKYINVKLYGLYGQSESSYTSGTYINTKEEIECIGEINEKIEVKILTKNKEIRSFKEVEDEIEGELIIKSDFLYLGYYHNGKIIKENFIGEQMFLTGDIVSVKNKKIYYLGRNDRQIKIRGYRINVEEIENSLLKIKNIIECVVIPKINLKENINLIGILKVEKNVNLMEINEELKKELPKYMLLNRIIIVEELYKTISGKTDYKKYEALIVED